MEEEERKFNEEFSNFFEMWDWEFVNLQDLFVTSDENLEVKMIQTGRLEAVTAVNSSCFVAIGNPFERAEALKRKREEELDEARWGKRPATAYIPNWWVYG
ncbi:hypothetical protein SLEP1_g53067 [Rubroshorea leprosula]|uniref:Uncharacterized protein n=1 Tax=Rubroshorea leprosula TaxID=152421 RepID=A0AAV5M898_9ROSI|nr:hypothetical protein SLEP1_g53067 [Rubroshorea leprosula]